MMFSSVIWFWLSAAVAVPILIHLWNKKSGTPVLLGTFRFLPKDNSAKASRIELHEVPLLIIRVLIVMTIVFLLSVFYLNRLADPVNIVSITETERAEGFVNYTNPEMDSIEIELSPEEINTHGWWAIISMIDEEYHPETIRINGDLSDSRFGKNRRPVYADLQWNNVENEPHSENILWPSEDGQFVSFINERVGSGVRGRIEFESEPGADAIVKEPIHINVNENASTFEREGVQFTAEYWHLPVRFEAQSELIIIEIGEERWSLQQVSDSAGTTDLLETNPVSSIQLSLSNLYHTDRTGELLMSTSIHNIPVLSRDGREFQLNGEIEENAQAWFFAGITHKMLKEGLGFDHQISPVLSDQLRHSAKSLSTERQPKNEPVSAKFWLMGLLLLLWTAERWMAPAREM